MPSSTDAPALIAEHPQRGTTTSHAQPYGPRVTRALPAMRRGFRLANRFLALPLLRAGLGPLLSTPATGSLMVLRARGRRSGAWREVPLGYVIRDGCVYCCAGFGRRTDWLRNIEADPVVELLLPGGAIAGIAAVVVDHGEQALVMRQLMGSMSVISRPMLGDLRVADDARLVDLAASLPLVRIRPTGLAAGPWDPGGRGWLLFSAVGATLVALSAWRRLRARRPRSGVP
jgi:deazaflavin-dependent oxidoreductase (nitroreductase family)